MFASLEGLNWDLNHGGEVVRRAYVARANPSCNWFSKDHVSLARQAKTTLEELGLIVIDPQGFIRITVSGQQFSSGLCEPELFLHQLLHWRPKGQSKGSRRQLDFFAGSALAALILDLGSLSVAEIGLFALYMTNEEDYPRCRSAIECFRKLGLSLANQSEQSAALAAVPDNLPKLKPRTHFHDYPDAVAGYFTFTELFKRQGQGVNAKIVPSNSTRATSRALGKVPNEVGRFTTAVPVSSTTQRPKLADVLNLPDTSTLVPVDTEVLADWSREARGSYTSASLAAKRIRNLFLWMEQNHGGLTVNENYATSVFRISTASEPTLLVRCIRNVTSRLVAEIAKSHTPDHHRELVVVIDEPNPQLLTTYLPQPLGSVSICSYEWLLQVFSSLLQEKRATTGNLLLCHMLTLANQSLDTEWTSYASTLVGRTAQTDETSSTVIKIHFRNDKASTVSAVTAAISSLIDLANGLSDTIDGRKKHQTDARLLIKESSPGLFEIMACAGLVSIALIPILVITLIDPEFVSEVIGKVVAIAKAYVNKKQVEYVTSAHDALVNSAANKILKYIEIAERLGIPKEKMLLWLSSDEFKDNVSRQGRIFEENIQQIEFIVHDGWFVDRHGPDQH